MRKSGSAVFLMEMMVIILFFSLSVMIIFRLFVSAHIGDQESIRLNDSLLEAKNTVELFKANGAEIFSGGIEWELQPQSPGQTADYYIKKSPEDSSPTTAYILEVEITAETTPLGVYEFGEIRAYADVDGVPEGEPFLVLQIGHYRQGQTAGSGVR